MSDVESRMSERYESQTHLFQTTCYPQTMFLHKRLSIDIFFLFKLNALNIGFKSIATK